jgi:hypothetical protein
VRKNDTNPGKTVPQPIKAYLKAYFQIDDHFIAIQSVKQYVHTMVVREITCCGMTKSMPEFTSTPLLLENDAIFIMI